MNFVDFTRRRRLWAAIIHTLPHVTSVWDRVGPIAAPVIERRSLAHASTRIVATDPARQPRLRGAATLVIQHFGAPNIA